jgi:hypothetical protein
MRTPRIELPTSAPAKSWFQSLFWPLEFLVLCVGLGTAMQLYDLNENRLATLHNIRQLTPRAEAGLADKKRFLALVQEIGGLAGRDKTASALLESFAIQFRPDQSTSTEGK